MMCIFLQCKPCAGNKQLLHKLEKEDLQKIYAKVYHCYFSILKLFKFVVVVFKRPPAVFIDYMAYKASKALMGFTYIISCVERPTVFPNKTSLYGQN